MRQQSGRQSGFTLVELIVVVAIVAILAAFAYPAFQDQIMKSRRSTALAALSDAASRQEQFFLDNKTYATTRGAINMPATTEGGYYTLNVNAPTPLTGYSLSAAPQGTQASDSCGTLTLTSAGVKSPANCW